MTKMFGFSERIAALASVIWLTCSTFLVYTQDAQQNNQILLFVLLSYSYILAYLQENKLKFLVLSGLSASASLLIRTSSIIHVFTILMFTISCLLFYHSKILISIRKLIPWILGFAPLAILGRFLDYLRYGSPWTTGQSLAVQQINTDPKWDGFPPLPANYPFLNDPYIGIVNVLFSPVKSIFIYDPLFIPCLIIGAIFWNRLSFFLKTYIIVGIVNLTLHIILTSKLIFWGGDWAWGARYHVTSIHLLIIPLLALLTREILLSKKWRKWCLQGMLVIALLVQIASVSMSYNVEITQSPFYQKYLAPESYASQFRLGERIGNIACQIYPDISKQCTKIDWVWPFKKNPTLIWIWRLLLVLSITSLLWFWRHIESLIALTRNL